MLWQWVLQGQAGVEQCLRGAPGYLLQENGREVSCSLAMTRTASRYECISVEFTEQNCSPVLPSNQLWIIKEELNIVSRPVTSQNTVHCIDWNLQQIAILELRNELSIWSKDVIQTKLSYHGWCCSCIVSIVTIFGSPLTSSWTANNLKLSLLISKF